MFPRLSVQVDGKSVSAGFHKALVQLKVTDKEGIGADSLELTFNDAPPHFQSPRRGARISVSFGTLDAPEEFLGSFVVDRVDFECLPFQIRVGAHSADMRVGMKAQKTRHWDNISVSDIVSQIAKEYALENKISEVVSKHIYTWIGQQDESDLHFLERLARRHHALFTIKNGVLLWLERGAGKTASGKSIPVATIRRSDIILQSCKVMEKDVDRFAKVKAYWQDMAVAKRQSVLVDADPDASGEHVIRDAFSSKQEAESAAKAAAVEMLRGSITTACTVVGRPGLLAGQPVVYSGVRPVVDGLEFILETVTHDFAKSSGLKTSFRGKLKSPET